MSPRAHRARERPRTPLSSLPNPWYVPLRLEASLLPRRARVSQRRRQRCRFRHTRLAPAPALTLAPLSLARTQPYHHGVRRCFRRGAAASARGARRKELRQGLSAAIARPPPLPLCPSSFRLSCAAGPLPCPRADGRKRLGAALWQQEQRRVASALAHSLSLSRPSARTCAPSAARRCLTP